MENYKNCNAQEVLNKVEDLINVLEAKKANIKSQGWSWMVNTKQSVKINDVYNDLSIFDWWKDTLSLSNLKDMRKFLKEAIKLGFNGYVCFKVGVSGCANGMWAHTKESENGYSPDDCATLYKSFTPAYNYWSFSPDGNEWLPSRNEKFDSIKTMKQLEKLVIENRV